ncbi:MAG: asparagine synthase-related protein [Muribaculaceae bacterium]|nr:asparagine synthase-related protein [Roseburia sp.]MCM1431218.1 asparagine synthase-related protein [Muribaculaceae bacterium]MCM1492296.1 asparagine synthase-related protein [Muribaculaceae bacterium]
MIDKKYCMSSYLALRYIERNDMDFYEGMQHEDAKAIRRGEQIQIKKEENIDIELQKTFDSLKDEKLGILLSGGMDSGILASYMRGCDAYTFRFLGGSYQREELERAEYYAKVGGLRLHYVDINWKVATEPLPLLMKGKAEPVHSIEPQLYQAAVQAKCNGVERLVTGASADLIFGGMDKLLAQDWLWEDFMKRYTFTQPEDVLADPADMSYVFRRYRNGNKIDFLKFMKEVSLIELLSSYRNAFAVAGMPYIDPYAKMVLAEPLDLERIRKGESKYLIRHLYKEKYPDIEIPEKIPMPRPVDFYFKDWKGPRRYEFRKDIDMEKFTGNQKWQIYCLEQFLNMFEK